MFERFKLNVKNWTMIGVEANTATIQNFSFTPIILEFTEDPTAPTTDAGIIFDVNEGVIKTNITTLTFKALPTYIWAKMKSGRDDGGGTVVSETDGIPVGAFGNFYFVSDYVDDDYVEGNP